MSKKRPRKKKVKKKKAKKPMGAGEAKKIATKAITDIILKKEKDIAWRKKKDKQDYKSAYEISPWKLGELVREIEKEAKVGKTILIHRSSKSDRNANKEQTYTQGEFHGLRDELKKLGYQTECFDKSEFISDCDGHGDSYHWMELHIKWV